MKPKCITMAEYREAEESNQGFCTECREFTHDSSEPDAEKYECPDCGAHACYGTMTALMMGFIEVE